MERNDFFFNDTATTEIYTYIAELMKIPVGENTKKYNRDKSAVHGNTVCVRAREFGSYRSLVLREKMTRKKITELLAQISRAEKQSSPRLPLMRAELREETVKLADLTLRRRRLEERRDKLKGELVKAVVQYRYFEDPSRRIPSWSETAKNLGIALTGEELRRYVCKSFEEQPADS